MGLENNDNVIILNDEEGNEVAFEFLDLITYRGREYVALLPDDQDADEVVILQVEELDAENESYIGVENEFTLSAVFELFKERHRDDFKFCD